MATLSSTTRMNDVPANTETNEPPQTIDFDDEAKVVELINQLYGGSDVEFDDEEE